MAARLALLPRVVGTGAFGLLCGILCGLLLALGVPHLAGWRSYTVMSGSMEPAIHTGDVVVNRQIHPRDARADQVLTFRDPAGSGRLITHRALHVEVSGTTARITTKGDANTTVERFAVRADGDLGQVALRLPRLGYPLAWVRSGPGPILFLALPALGLGAFTTLRILRTPTRT